MFPCIPFSSYRLLMIEMLVLQFTYLITASEKNPIKHEPFKMRNRHGIAVEERRHVVSV